MQEVRKKDTYHMGETQIVSLAASKDGVTASVVLKLNIYRAPLYQRISIHSLVPMRWIRGTELRPGSTRREPPIQPKRKKKRQLTRVCRLWDRVDEHSLLWSECVQEWGEDLCSASARVDESAKRCRTYL